MGLKTVAPTTRLSPLSSSLGQVLLWMDGPYDLTDDTNDSLSHVKGREGQSTLVTLHFLSGSPSLREEAIPMPQLKFKAPLPTPIERSWVVAIACVQFAGERLLRVLNLSFSKHHPSYPQ